MKNYDELKNYYFEELVPKLKDIDKNRDKYNNSLKKVKRVLIYIFIGVVVLSILSPIITDNLIYIRNNDGIMETRIENEFFQLLFYTAFILVLIYYFTRKMFISIIENEYKQNIISKIMKFLSPNINFNPNQHISRKTIEDSHLFNNSFDELDGEDYIYGEIDGIPIEASDIEIYKLENKNNKKEKFKRKVFFGLFVTSKMNKNLYGETLVLPDVAQKLFGNILGRNIQSIIKRKNYELIKMDSVEFEKEFVIYSTDKIEARYILTHNIMESILDMKNKIGSNIMLSFRDNRVFVAFDGFEIFKIDISKPIDYNEIFDNIYYTLNVTVGIVENLNLNRDIFK